MAARIINIANLLLTIATKIGWSILKRQGRFPGHSHLHFNYWLDRNGHEYKSMYPLLVAMQEFVKFATKSK